jgi:hypothetical protein|tara:strand:- start:5830 stop:6123 length:294 start_codon:yes stop_codon:yes gene_type:complete
MFNFIDKSRMKMPKWVFWQPYKSTFKKLGLHHASITAVAIGLGHLIAPQMGHVMAVFCLGWYGSREWGGGNAYPPKSFEVMDFCAPLAVSLTYSLVV